jgi:predicted DNA-binding WGR domain protein
VDAELQSLLRTAEERDDGPSWLRAAQALARAARADDAGRALALARARGESVSAVEDSLVPALEAFSQREVGTRFELGPLSLAAWSADARTLYAVENARAVLAFDLTRGTHRTIAVIEGKVTALGADLEGRHLAVGFVRAEKGKVVPTLATIDLATGNLSPPIGKAHKWLREVGLAPGVVFCAETDRARAYPLDAAGNPASDKSTWSLTASVLSLDRSGAVVALRDQKLLLHDRLAKAPRVAIPIDVPPAALARFHLGAAGTRAAIVAEDLVLLEHDGTVLARAPLENAGQPLYDAVVAPSGRLLAIMGIAGNQRTTTLDLLDAMTGKKRRFDLGARPKGPTWSLSGRTLAVPTDQGTIVLIEAPGIAPVAETSPRENQDAGWVELRSDNWFWRARCHGALLEFHHGPLGTKGKRGAAPFASPAAAERELARRIREKEEAGYSRKGGEA